MAGKMKDQMSGLVNAGLEKEGQTTCTPLSEIAGSEFEGPDCTGWQVAYAKNQIIRKKRPHSITARTVVQPVVKATSQSNGKGQILTPWGSETPERISMKLTWNI